MHILYMDFNKNLHNYSRQVTCVYHKVFLWQVNRTTLFNRHSHCSLLQKCAVPFWVSLKYKRRVIVVNSTYIWGPQGPSYGNSSLLSVWSNGTQPARIKLSLAMMAGEQSFQHALVCKICRCNLRLPYKRQFWIQLNSQCYDPYIPWLG